MKLRWAGPGHMAAVVPSERRWRAECCCDLLTEWLPMISRMVDKILRIRGGSSVQRLGPQLPRNVPQQLWSWFLEEPDVGAEGCLMSL